VAQPNEEANVDDLTGAALLKPRSLHASFKKPTNSGKRLPSRKRASVLAQDDETSISERGNFAEPVKTDVYPLQPNNDVIDTVAPSTEERRGRSKGPPPPTKPKPKPKPVVKPQPHSSLPDIVTE
jgi:hypothetical protein